MPEILEGDYKVGRVLSVSNGLAWVRWVGYNFLGDTCEPIEHIEPRSKLTSFLKGKQVSVDLSAPRAFLSKHLISMATSNKISERGPTFRKESSIERLAIAEIGMGVLNLVKPPSVKLEVVHTGSGKSTSITIWDMDSIADVVAIHLFKAEVGHGALRIHCGNATFEDMMMFIPPLKLTVVDGASPAFKCETTTMTFDGLYGTPRMPKIFNEEDRYLQDEINKMTSQAKLTLEQLWRTTRLPHNLIAKGWHRLPEGHGVGYDRLPANTAIPRAAAKRREKAAAAQASGGAKRRRAQ